MTSRGKHFTFKLYDNDDDQAKFIELIEKTRAKLEKEYGPKGINVTQTMIFMDIYEQFGKPESPVVNRHKPVTVGILYDALEVVISDIQTFMTENGVSMRDYLHQKNPQRNLPDSDEDVPSLVVEDMFENLD